MAATTASPVTLDVTDAGTNRKKITVKVAAAKVNEVLDSIIKEFTNRAALPGFRPGKAPQAIILRKYQNEIMQEARQRLSDLSFQAFQKETNLVTLGRITMDPEHRPVLERGKEFSYSFSTDVQPPITLVDAATLEIEQEELTIFDEEITHRLDMVAKRAGKQEKLDTGAVIADDQVELTYTVAVDGKDVDTEAQAFWHIHGDHMHGLFVGEVKAADVIGKEVGKPFTYSAKLPKDYKVEAAREKDAIVTVTLKTIHRTTPVPINEDMAKQFGMESVEKLKEMVRQTVMEEVEQNIHQATIDKLTDALIAKIDFPLPEKTLATAQTAFLRQFLHHYRMTPEMIEQPGNEKIKEIATSVAAKQAERTLRTSLIVGEYAKKFEIKVQPEEFNAELEGLAARNQMDVKKFLKQVDQDELVELEHNMMTHKTLEYLLSLAKVKMTPRKMPDLSGHGHDHEGHDHDEADHDHGEESHEGHEHAEHAHEHKHEGHEHPHVDHDKAAQPEEHKHNPEHGHKPIEHGHKGHQHGRNP